MSIPRTWVSPRLVLVWSMLTIGPGQPVHVAPLPAGPRVTSDPYLTGSASMASGAMPKMIVFCKLTCHQSTEREALFIGSNTTPSVLLVEVSGLRLGLPPTVIGNCVPQSRGSWFVLLGKGWPFGWPQRAGSSKPGALTAVVCG